MLTVCLLGRFRLQSDTHVRVSPVDAQNELMERQIGRRRITSTFTYCQDGDVLERIQLGILTVTLRFASDMRASELCTLRLRTVKVGNRERVIPGLRILVEAQCFPKTNELFINVTVTMFSFPLVSYSGTLS
jgi:hypothetical protein